MIGWWMMENEVICAEELHELEQEFVAFYGQAVK